MRTLVQIFSQHFMAALPTEASRLASPTLPGASPALAAITLAQIGPAKLVLVITNDMPQLECLFSDISALGRAASVTPLLLPHALPDDPEAVGLRQQTLQTLCATQEAAPTPRVLITTLHALMQPVPTPNALQEASVYLKVGTTHHFDSLITTLAERGYTRATEVDTPGTLAVRGGLLDIWPPANATPLRIEFFGDQVDSLRAFDPTTQRSNATLPELWLPPCSDEHLPTIDLIKLLPHALNLLWLDHNLLRATAALPPPKLRKPRSWDSLTAALTAHSPTLQLFSGDPPPANTPTLPLEIAAVPGLAELGSTDALHPEILMQTRQKLLADFNRRAASGQRVLLCADTAGGCELLANELGGDTRVTIHRATLSGGFCLPGLTVAAQPDLYAPRKQHRHRPTAIARGGRVESATDLDPGDLVVHLDHGIGRFLGSTEIEVGGERSEVFTLEYADGAKLHVPVSHAHLLSRYVGVAGHRAKLHRLGGCRWTRDKIAAERAVADLASSLLDTQAKRKVVEGLKFNVEPLWLREFEASFPWQETIDQTRVIAEVKADMSTARPMDRLVCGDAGYGKTEIAMRAAFIAVMNGYQVAVLVPTTVLAEQHYETFCARMAAFPVKIAVMSRFHSRARCAAIIEEARTGQADIVIGTHALLAANVAFNNLGLLIIDEEQRFGVKHKEKLKLARQMVDVLTLSATPIPRTLYMSMTGARDMSLLQTPPNERVAVETKVARDADTTIRSAIEQELNRRGQVFFLYNRVMTIPLMHQRLERLLPQANIAIAHGQMPSAQLARVMRDFEAGAIDVLLCTTIIESGLDIPRANTILVHRADRFGIADLYQLRGRVGRSAQKGFAWLLLPDYGHIDEDARQRIAALQKHSGLGAGFNLALRDLEIRGAGNLLGAAQSGHIAAIGFGLYCQLLKRTIARLKGETPPLLVSVNLALDFIELSPGTLNPERAACLPYAYIEDEGHRMTLHRRIAEVSSIKEARALQREIADRYGKPPPPVMRLLRLCELRVYAALKAIDRIETRTNKVYLYKENDRAPLTFRNRLPLLRGTTTDQLLAALTTIIKQLTRTAPAT